jgi:hypothetical protein
VSFKFNPFTGTLDLVNDLYRGALAAAPGSPVDGEMYYNITVGKLYVYHYGWHAIGPVSNNIGQSIGLAPNYIITYAS